MAHGDMPPLAALFQVVFDQKVGYSIAWKRSLPDADLGGIEYKCLPSGLHSVESDLVYFTQGQLHVGISAFAQEEADSEHRNARFCAIGALVSSAHGQLGRCWLHAAALKKLARQLVGNSDDKTALDSYWKTCQQTNEQGVVHDRHSPRVDGIGSTRLSESQHGLKLDVEGVADHPALYMPALLDCFGPLIFPLCRASLLRKRILMLGSPPVQRNCSTVYIVSILSSLPRTACEVLPADTEPLARTDSLFSVGISDIPLLSQARSRAGWIATTTDDILGEKQQLWDILVELTPKERGSAKRWPRLRTSDGRVIQATQRDLRKYRLLRGELRRMRHARTKYRDSVEQDGQQAGDDDQTPLMRSATLLHDSEGHQTLRGDEDEVVEPVSWAALAYNGFMWWASAGEEDASAMEESEADRELLSELPDLQSVMEDPSSRAAHGEQDEAEEELIDSQEVATVLTAFFHRITGLIVGTLADIVAEADDETEVGIEEDVIDISAQDVKKMGLDIWSERDREFVEEAVRLYFGREAKVQGGERLQICGVKVC
ncbi:hypothetical protein KC332_g18716 [Hortaea werneckii]|uniref:DUF4484 domain-containing protein n=2 Tax=Hortaea werneckii TaxID=91943 RepID=A0A3M7ISG2_HORWE|nr:hypothetical protein KC350_g18902 [Hortaea werneckii]OTA28133.1 hypothetical protein BTJ68_09910 [Hortaea werneckii EXF-2000]KAI6787238.1 hypothetical protein KC358_g18829 [Hortaea werneckii]KAI6893362.1 hypothetical protein KC348_g18741 [Hortaea werneckii]KAI6916935.1 hypothetical protein KC341_g18816 [Hortaea werneckii]